MFGSLYTFLIRLGIACLLFVNAVAILNKRRFLSKHHLTLETAQTSDHETATYHEHPPENSPIRMRVASLIHAIQLLRPVLIVVNGVTTLFLLVAGGLVF